MGGNGWVVDANGRQKRTARKPRKVLVATRIEETDKMALDRLARLTDRTTGEVIREACRLYILSQERAIGRAEKEWEESSRESGPLDP